MSDRWAVTKLRNRDLELAILPGIGGRLWDVTFQGHSLLFQNPDLVGRPFDDADLARLPTRSPHFGFPLWGGEKTWIAPDTEWVTAAPYPVLDSGAYRVTARQRALVEMTSPLCPITQLTVTRRITLISDRSWSLEHVVTNHGTAPRRTGIWSVMMIDTPAAIGVAMDIPEVHPVFGHAGPLVARHDGCVVAECSRQQEFKVGLPNRHGQTLIRFNAAGPWLICSVPPPLPHDRFAHQHPVEVFNSGDYPYCEAEWHAPMAELLPGETLRFEQTFRLWPPGSPPVADLAMSAYEDLLTCMS